MEQLLGEEPCSEEELEALNYIMGPFPLRGEDEGADEEPGASDAPLVR